MARYIDVEAVGIGKAKRELFVVPEYADGWNNAIEIFEKAPTAKVEEVKHGYWKDRYGNKYINHLYECSVCSKEALFESYKNELDQWNERQALTPVCPYCGAKMDGRSDS